MPEIRSPHVHGTGTRMSDRLSALGLLSCVHDPKTISHQVRVPDDALLSSPRVQVAGERMRDGIRVGSLNSSLTLRTLQRSTRCQVRIPDYALLYRVRVQETVYDV